MDFVASLALGALGSISFDREGVEGKEGSGGMVIFGGELVWTKLWVRCFTRSRVIE